IETAFWQAVESEDLDAVAGTLALDDHSPLRSVVPALSSWRRTLHERSTIAGWRYRVTWEPVDAASDVRTSGTWLLVVPAAHQDDALAVTVREALHAHGAEVRTAAVPAAGFDLADVLPPDTAVRGVV